MAKNEYRNTPERKKHILDYIAVFIASNGFSPSVRDIADGVGLALANVHQNLVILKEEGRIDFQEGKRRTITIVEQD